VDSEYLAELVAEAESDKIESLRKSLNAAQKKLADREEHDERMARAVYDAVRSVHQTIEYAPVAIPKKDKRKAHGEVAVPWIADLQLGKRTPDYNSDVARERMDLWADKVIELTNIQRAAHPIRKAHVWMLGDIVEGEDIFPGQEWLIDSSLYRQVTKNGPEILSDFLRKMLANFDEVHVVAVIGNHGRIGKKGKSHPETNTDRMVYQITSMMLKDEDRLTWNFAEPDNDGDRGWHSVDRIGNYSCLLVHGDQFKGQLGIPWYGIRKKVLGWKAMAAAHTLPFPDFQDLAFGHWHQPMSMNINGIGVRGSGSPESYNDYAAENMAGMSRPSQRLMFVAPDKGIVTAEYPEVWLD